MRKIIFLLFFVFLIGCNNSVKQPSGDIKNKLDYVIPQAVKTEKFSGEFVFSGQLSIICDSEFIDIKNLLNDEFSKYDEFNISEQAKKKIIISKSQNKDEQGGEAYVLEIKLDEISISGDTYGGVFYGMQTLLQLMSLDSTINIPCGKITDKPKYAWRGFMLDVARFFYPKEELLKMIDLLAFYKINTLQLHLTDDQGWRIEIDSLPKLTQIGSVNDDSLRSGFYSKADMREIIKYARLRNIDIVPEIDIPGHSQAAIASYPELSCFENKVEVRSFKHRKPNPIDGTPFSDPLCVGKEKNYVFIDKVIKEIAELFPSKYIHLGGDECSQGAWKKCSLCQKKEREEGLKDEDELQGYFMTRVEAIVRSYGKTAIGWDEVYETKVPKTFNIMAWREEIWGVDAANDNYKVVMAPSHYYYLSRNQEEYNEKFYGVLTPLRFMYNFRVPFAKINPEFRDNIMGVQSCFWGGAKWDATMYRMFPRFLVFSEHSWASNRSDLPTFLQKISHQYKVLDKKNVNYYVEHPFGLYDDVCYTKEYKVDLSVPISFAEIRYTLDGSEPTTASELFTKAFYVPIGTIIKAKTFLPNGRSSITVEGTSRKVKLAPSVDVKNVQHGLNVKIAKGKIKSTVDFKNINEIYSGIIDKIKYPGDSLRHDFALSFSGYIKIPEDGVYTFHSSSCDGSNLYIDNELFLSNDGCHPKLTFIKRIALAKGYHKLKLDYFYSSIFEKFFMLEIDGAGMERQDVPGNMLFH